MADSAKEKLGYDVWENSPNDLVWAMTFTPEKSKFTTTDDNVVGTTDQTT